MSSSHRSSRPRVITHKEDKDTTVLYTRIPIGYALLADENGDPVNLREESDYDRVRIELTAGRLAL